MQNVLDNHSKTDTKISHNGTNWIAEKDGKIIASDASYVGLIAELNRQKVKGR